MPVLKPGKPKEYILEVYDGEKITIINKGKKKSE